MAAEMQNLDIRDFPTVSSVDDRDHAVLSMFSGISAKMKFGMFRTLTAQGITPSIGEDGEWYIGENGTGVPAEGLTPEFRRGTTCIEFKYTREDDSAWRPLLNYSDVKMRWENFTPEQIDELTLHYEELTEEQIAELQKPANDMIAKLESTDREVLEAETKRVKAETAREEAETKRAAAEYLRERGELQRIENENARAAAEESRVKEESERAAAEDARVAAETKRVKAEEYRNLSEQGRINSEQQRMDEFQKIKKTLGDQSQTISMDEEGNIIITFGAETNFKEGYIEDSGDVVLVFDFV